MMITAFSFGLSWVVFAFAFYGVTMLVPGIHSVYHETIFKIGFIIGFFDAAMLRLAKVANFQINWVVLYLVTALVNWGLIGITNNTSADYSIVSHTAPIYASLILSAFVIAFDSFKNRILADVRL